MKMNAETTRPQEQGNTEDLHANKTHLPRFSGAWETRRFGELFKRLNVNAHQIKTSEYQTQGLHPVIDQGQGPIVSFSDQTDKLFKTPPGGVIVFGDHTRIVKFVDMDFLVGADGTQLLAMQGNNVAKFFFYQFLIKKIPDTGYNRHFKFLNDLTFEIPPLAEQRAIAEVLSDVDGLIQSLDALIAKKRAIKRAAMQQLLTGKTRLPGFSGAWETKRLGEVASIGKGQLITESSIKPGIVPVVAGGKQPAYFHNYANRTGKTITVSASGAYAGYVAYWDRPIFASDCSTISDSPNYSIEYIFYQMLLRQEQIYRTQTGGAQPHVHGKDLDPLVIPIPPIREQRAIAAILSDMDAEIAALERRRDKTRDVKQGMMQELLTGRIRLVKSE